MPYCKSCGTQVREEAHFCPGCGTEREVPTPDVTAVMPRVPDAAPPSFTVQTPAPAAPPRRSVNVWALVSIVAVILAVGAGAAFFLTRTESVESATTDSAKKSDSVRAEKRAETADEEEPDAGDALSAADSYDALADSYAALGELSNRLGVARADGTYGGTGFAYDVFNPAIGSPDARVRSDLVASSAAMLKTCSDARTAAEAIEVSDEYESQKQAIVACYVLLETRAKVLKETADAALDNPDRAAWGSVLSPRSTDTRKQFEAAYPLAAPKEL